MVKFLGDGGEKVYADAVSDEGGNRFEVNGREYLVLTDDEADQLCKDKILEMVWAFNANFLVGHMRIESHDFRDTLKSIKAIQDKCCESANALLRAALADENDFVRKAVAADGRGHCLAGYDNLENETKYKGKRCFIYRLN